MIESVLFDAFWDEHVDERAEAAHRGDDLAIHHHLEAGEEEYDLFSLISVLSGFQTA